jgi:hypothetical protein
MGATGGCDKDDSDFEAKGKVNRFAILPCVFRPVGVRYGGGGVGCNQHCASGKKRVEQGSSGRKLGLEICCSFCWTRVRYNYRLPFVHSKVWNYGL